MPPTDTGSSIAALVKVHREVMQAALERRKREPTILDRLPEEHGLRRAGVGQPGTAMLHPHFKS